MTGTDTAFLSFFLLVVRCTVSYLIPVSAASHDKALPLFFNSLLFEQVQKLSPNDFHSLGSLSFLCACFLLLFFPLLLGKWIDGSVKVSQIETVIRHSCKQHHSRLLGLKVSQRLLEYSQEGLNKALQNPC